MTDLCNVYRMFSRYSKDVTSCVHILQEGWLLDKTEKESYSEDQKLTNEQGLTDEYVLANLLE